MKGQLGAERRFNNELINGNNIILGLDIRIQYIVRKELLKASKV